MICAIDLYFGVKNNNNKNKTFFLIKAKNNLHKNTEVLPILVCTVSSGPVKSHITEQNKQTMCVK